MLNLQYILKLFVNGWEMYQERILIRMNFLKIFNLRYESEKALAPVDNVPVSRTEIAVRIELLTKALDN